MNMPLRCRCVDTFRRTRLKAGTTSWIQWLVVEALDGSRPAGLGHLELESRELLFEAGKTYSLAVSEEPEAAAASAESTSHPGYAE